MRLILPWLFLLFFSCKSTEDVCKSGSQEDCACADKKPGLRTCASDGQSYGACNCAVPSASTQCQAIETQHPTEGRTHVETCSPVSYGTMPPSSGNHWPIWADFKTYTEPVKPGFFVHSLEHGAVILFYNCPQGCAKELADLQAVVDNFTKDFPGQKLINCDQPTQKLILMPYPDLDVQFAASAWGWTLRSACFDKALFQAFMNQHYAQGPEDTCASGIDLAEMKDTCAPPTAPAGQGGTGPLPAYRRRTSAKAASSSATRARAVSSAVGQR